MAKKDVTGFKAAFGVSKKNPDGKKLAAAIGEQIKITRISVELLETLQAPQAQQARADFISLQVDALDAARTYQTDGVTELQRCAFDLLSQTKANRLAAKKKPLSVAVGNPPAPVQVFWTDIPGYEELSPNDRAAAAQKVGEKIARGKGLLDALVPPNGGPVQQLPAMSRNEKKRAVTDLAWALKTAAQEKVGEPYEKGALTAPGGEQLRQFLDSCGEDIYPRRSTHLGDQQKQPGQSPRGMDFYGGSATLAGAGGGDGLLPMGMNTILMQMVTDIHGAKRMYIKMETASAHGSAGAKNKKDTKGIPGGGRSDKVSYTELLTHGMNITRDTDQHDDLKSRRETTPDGVYDLCKAVVKQSDDKRTKAKLVAALGKNKEKLRINKFLKALVDSEDALTSDAAETAMATLLTKLDELFGDADLSAQAGGEVAL